MNKFLGYKSEGHRGHLIAIRDDGIQAIILAMTGSSDPEDGIEWGRFYLVEELDPDQYPIAKSTIDRVPDVDGWTVIEDVRTIVGSSH